MEPEYELCYNAKVTFSFSDTPEEVGIFSITCGKNIPVSGDNCNLNEISGRHDMI